MPAWKQLAITGVCLAAVLGLVAPTAVAMNAGDVSASTEFGVSPDGVRLAYPVPSYDSYGDPVTIIWVCAVDGSSKRRVSVVPGDCSVRWRSARELVAFQFDQPRIYLISAAGGKPAAVSLTDNFRWIQPAVSPDGNHVAFNAVRKMPASAGVFVQDIPPRGIRALSLENVKSFVSWSPDSTKVVYGAGGYERSYGLTIVDAASGASQDTGVDGVGASWSPDGKWIAYTGEIVRGGSWWGGLPIDGRILKMNTATRSTVALTEPGVNQVDPKTGERECSGAIRPVWSPDGRKIAYHRVHQVMSKQLDTTTSEDELWVMNEDGTGRRRVWEKPATYAWMRDGSSLFVKGESGITRVAVDTGERHEVTAWRIPEPPKPAIAEYKSLRVPGARIEYVGIDPAYARAILAVAAAARNVYASELHCYMPVEVVVTGTKDPRAQANLWNDGESHLFLKVRSMNDLAPPQQSGIFNIYGICHEMGHLAMYRRCRQLGFPDGIAEGWAHYAGSVVTDRVYAKLGPNLWPIPYDYLADGTARLRQQASQTPDAIAKAASAFYQAHLRFGPQKVFQALNQAMDGKPYGKDVMPKFVDALIAQTGDASVRSLFPDDLVNTVVMWETRERKITDQISEGMVEVKDGDGRILKYDSGKSSGMRSTAGGGHAVAFKLPSGNWAIDAVEVYGSRYGELTPPRRDFSIFLCDEDFNVIKETRIN